MLGLYKFEKVFRGGTLSGVFVADIQEVNDLIKSELELLFGEVLGKHSNVVYAVKEEDLTLVTTKEDVINIILEYDLINGIDPMEYIDETIESFGLEDYRIKNK